MQLINTPSQNNIKEAAKALKNGHLAAFPTETVYGLGADATNEKAVSRIYSVKGRPTDHPLIVHISSINLLDKWAIEIPEYAMKLARAFWPGPMTLILKRSHLAQDFVTGGQDFIGLRVPNQQIALSLLLEFEKLGGFGIAAPSANRFGAVSPTSALDVVEEIGELLGKDDLILDGKNSTIGIESTIIDCTNTQPSILRHGATTNELISELLCNSNIFTEARSLGKRTSGALKSHYSPKAKVLINAETRPGNGFIAMSNIPTPRGAIRLAAPDSLEEYAKVLYSALREADRKGIMIIVVIAPTGAGLSAAINDRLVKASTPNQLNIYKSYKKLF